MHVFDPGPRDDAAWRRFRWVLVSLVCCRGLVLLCVMPPFEAWDEYQHVGYVVHVARTGQAPVPGETMVPVELLNKLGQFPQPRCMSDPQCGYGTSGYARYWAQPEQGSNPRRLCGPAPLYEAQHGSFYYRLAAPVFELAGGVENLKRSVGLLRFLNLILTVMAVALAVEGARRLVCDDRAAGLVGILIAVQPLFLENGVRVANDALGVLLATLAIVWGPRLRERRMVYQCGLLGLVIGLAIRAKAVHYGLLPFAGYCWLGAVVRDRVGPRRAGFALAALVMGTLAVSQDEAVRSLARFGTITPMAEALHNRQAGRNTLDLLHAARQVDWRGRLEWIWLQAPLGVGGWSFLHPSAKQVKVHEIVAIACLLGGTWHVWPAARRRAPVFRSWQAPAACAVVCASYSIALAYHLVQSQLDLGMTSTGAWYASAAFLWLAVLLGGCGMSLPLGRLRFALPVLAVLSTAKAEAVLVAGLMVSTYSGGAGGWQALERLASLQPAFFGTATLLLSAAGGLALLAASLVMWARWAIFEPDRSSAAAATVPSPITVRLPARPNRAKIRPAESGGHRPR